MCKDLVGPQVEKVYDNKWGYKICTNSSGDTIETSGVMRNSWDHDKGAGVGDSV